MTIATNFVTALMTPFSPVEADRHTAALALLRATERAAEAVLQAACDDGDVDVFQIDALVDKSRVLDGVGYIYLDDNTRLSIALTSDVLVPIEEIVPEFQNENHIWLAVMCDDIDPGSLIWMFAEHVAGEMLSSSCVRC